MIYKYTKCESVIAKIMADADMSEKNIRITDMREWIFEAVEKIGAPVQYVHRESGVDGAPVLKLEDYQVPLPADLEKLTAVVYSTTKDGPWVPVRSNNRQFKEPIRNSKPKFIGPMYNENNMTIDKPAYIHTEDIQHDDDNIMRKPITSQSQIYDINYNRYYEKLYHAGLGDDPTYFIKPGWIVLNKQRGYVKLSYTSIATDERGYPLIPDLASYQEAIYWYVMMKLMFPKFINGSLGGRARYNAMVYQEIKNNWAFYRNQAYAEAMMPNDGEMRSIKNEWNKLVPEWDSDDTMFNSLGQRQLNYNDYYYGY